MNNKRRTGQWYWIALDTVLVDPKGNTVLHAPSGVTVGLARKIAVSLNCHDELKKTIRGLLKVCNKSPDTPENLAELQSALDQAKAILKKSEQK